MRGFIIRWNERFPIDYFWRKKYNIPFGSQEHKAANFILMAIDLKEDKMFKEYMKAKEEGSDKEYEGLSPKKNSNIIKMSQKEIEQEFDDIDLSQFND